MINFTMHGPNDTDGCGGVYLEFYAGVSTREIRIDKLTNGKWNLDIIVYGQRDMYEFDTLDEVIKDLVDFWWMSEDKADDVRKACESITEVLDVSYVREWLEERDEEEPEEDDSDEN